MRQRRRAELSGHEMRRRACVAGGRKARKFGDGRTRHKGADERKARRLALLSSSLRRASSAPRVRLGPLRLRSEDELKLAQWGVPARKRRPLRSAAVYT